MKGLAMPQDARQRILSLVEVTIATTLVVWFCVLRQPVSTGPFLLPLLVLAVVSLYWRDGGFAALGFRWPPSWRRTLLIALGALALVTLGAFFGKPLLLQPLGLVSTANPEMFGPLRGNLHRTLMIVAMVWVFAACGEELIYRRYVLSRIAGILGQGAAASIVAVLLSAALFAAGHFYQDYGGMLMRFIDGSIYGAAFVVSGRNLWVPVLAHGAFDTIAIAMVYGGVVS